VPAEAAAAVPEARGQAGFDCFRSAAAHEICAMGRKLAGSAQRRAGGGVLQHGSLRLGPDPVGARVAAGLQQEGATSLAELGFALDRERVLAACIAAFESVLPAELTEGTLDDVELAQTRELAVRHVRARDHLLPSGISREPVAGR
jgi:lipoate-protein ligase A